MQCLNIHKKIKGWATKVWIELKPPVNLLWSIYSTCQGLKWWVRDQTEVSLHQSSPKLEKISWRYHTFPMFSNMQNKIFWVERAIHIKTSVTSGRIPKHTALETVVMMAPLENINTGYTELVSYGSRWWDGERDVYRGCGTAHWIGMSMGLKNRNFLVE